VAQYILIRFEDDETARGALEGEPIRLGADGKVVGVYKAPTDFCSCEGVDRHTEVQARGAKYGWFMHKACGKPLKGNAQLPINMLTFEQEAEADPDYPDHALHIYGNQTIGRSRRLRALELIHGKGVK
jgi:hypothetical protein